MDPATPRFRTFAGVFRPVFLTILGAMLYLREGWLVGSTGLLGALAVILAAHVITGTTALSVSSVATNVRVRPGGAFAIIAQALGLEAGGAIGLPLFVAQTASAAMYLYAFTEGWAYMFPDHPAGVVVAVAFAIVGVLCWTSSALAARAQAVMFLVVIAAIASAFLGTLTHPRVSPTWLEGHPSVTLQQAFAIFFPAATGIMVGVGMSGSLADPRKSIPVGTLGAWGTTFVVYVVAAFWYATIATPTELVTNTTLFIERALVGEVVLFGLLSSTLMAALSSLVAAPRLLAAMAAEGVVPAGPWLAALHGGEPRRATGVALVLTGLFLLSGSLDAIAPIVTATFIVTYLAINLVVSVEQRLGMISFRPTFAVTPWVPVLGVVSAVFGLLLSSPTVGVVELVLVGIIYAWLQNRQLVTPWETVRSGLSISVAAWAARRVAHLERPERAWQPDLLVPVRDPAEAEALVPLCGALTASHGSVKLVAVIASAERIDPAMTALQPLGRRLQEQGAYATWTTVEAATYADGARVAVDALRGAFFPPNLVVVDASRHEDDGELQALVDRCRLHQLGAIAFLPHPAGALGPEGDVSVWLSDRSPEWDIGLHMANLDLPVLSAYLLVGARRGSSGAARLRLHTVVREVGAVAGARDFLARLIRMGRLPPDTVSAVHTGAFLDAVRADDAPVHVFGLASTVEVARLAALRDAAGGAALFLMDSGQESVLA